MLRNNAETDTAHLAQHPVNKTFVSQNSEDDGSRKLVLTDDHHKEKKWKNKSKNKEKYKCEVCNKVLSSLSNLKRHSMLHTGDRPFTCSHCDKTFSLKATLVNHIRLHTGEKPYACDVCEKTFRSKANLFVHHKVHTGEKKHKCGHCGHLFIQKGHYKLHLMTHTDKKSFICELCGKSFSHGVLLKRHSMIHKERKEFSCHVCDKKFCNKQNLECHLKAHTGIKDFKCENCGKNFQYKSALNRHIRQNELSPLGNCQYRQKLRTIAYECHYCKMTFVTKQRLRYHICKHTGEKPHECQYCKAKFTSRSSLKSHLKIHCRGKETSKEIKRDAKPTEATTCKSPSIPKVTSNILHCSVPPPLIEKESVILARSTAVTSIPATEITNKSRVEDFTKHSNLSCDSLVPVLPNQALKEEGSPVCGNEMKIECNNNVQECPQNQITDIKDEIDIHYEEIDEN